MNDPKAQQRAPDPPNGPGPAVPDERDAAIARLERALVEERENAAGLRKTNDELSFKAQILEKGYATQLADARTRMEAAQKELADLKAQKAASRRRRRGHPAPAERDARGARARDDGSRSATRTTCAARGPDRRV